MIRRFALTLVAILLVPFLFADAPRLMKGPSQAVEKTSAPRNNRVYGQEDLDQIKKEYTALAQELRELGKYSTFFESHCDAIERYERADSLLQRLKKLDSKHDTLPPDLDTMLSTLGAQAATRGYDEMTYGKSLICDRKRELEIQAVEKVKELIFVYDLVDNRVPDKEVTQAAVLKALRADVAMSVKGHREAVDPQLKGAWFSVLSQLLNKAGKHHVAESKLGIPAELMNELNEHRKRQEELAQLNRR